MTSLPALRDDTLGESADGGDAVTTAVMKALRDAELAMCARINDLSVHSRHRIVGGLATARSIIASLAPCAACGHRVVPSDNPIPQPVPSGTPSLPAADGQADAASGEHGAPVDGVG